MKAKTSIKTTLCILLLPFLMVMCSKDEKTYEKGPLTGSVQLYDRYGIEDTSYSNVKITLFEVNKDSVIIYPGSDGIFHSDDVILGDIMLFIDKPGYCGIRSILWNHDKGNDTIKKITLFEAMPFSYENFWLDYSSGVLSYSDSVNFTSNENYMVGHFMCFGFYSTASIKSWLVAFGTGSYTNVHYINSFVSASYSVPVELFISSGFSYGDEIFAVEYPVSELFCERYFEQDQDFTITSYKMDNPSNVRSFIFSQ
jgi:hypothetical protein